MTTKPNPYQSPSGFAPERPWPASALPPLRRPYKSIEGCTRFVQFCQVAAIAIIAIGAVQYGNCYFYLEGLSRGERYEEQFQSAARAGLVCALVMGASGVLYGISFLVWIYQAQRNLPVLGGKRATSPGTALALCLIPVVNLVTIFMVLREIWRHSDPQKHGVPAAGSESSITWWLLSTWISTVLSVFSSQSVQMEGMEPQQLMMTMLTQIVACLIGIVQLSIAYYVLGCISVNQSARHEQMQSPPDETGKRGLPRFLQAQPR